MKSTCFSSNEDGKKAHFFEMSEGERELGLITQREFFQKFHDKFDSIKKVFSKWDLQQVTVSFLPAIPQNLVSFFTWISSTN